MSSLSEQENGSEMKMRNDMRRLDGPGGWDLRNKAKKEESDHFGSGVKTKIVNEISNEVFFQKTAALYCKTQKTSLITLRRLRSKRPDVTYVLRCCYPALTHPNCIARLVIVVIRDLPITIPCLGKDERANKDARAKQTGKESNKQHVRAPF